MQSQVSATETPLPTTIGPYHIIKAIGEGAMATVYRAEKKGLGDFSKRVALKVVVSKLATEANFVRWFYHEAQLGSYLSHPNVVETLDFGECDGHLFLAMEYIDGPTLRQLLGRYIGKGEGLPWDIAITLMIGALRGLAYAHKATDYQGQALGLIHRDLKPSNILIDRFGQARLADFGVAYSDGEGDEQQSGVIKGTVRYMSPEQAVGSRNLDNRSDIFSVGLILYELLTMTALYPEGPQREILHIAQAADIDDALEAIPEIECRDEILTILRKCLAKDPEERFETADDLRLALRNVLQSHQRAPDMGTWIDGVGWRHLGVSSGQPSASSKTSLAPGAASLSAIMELEAEPEDMQPSIEVPKKDIDKEEAALMAALQNQLQTPESTAIPLVVENNTSVIPQDPQQRKGLALMLAFGLIVGAASMAAISLIGEEPKDQPPTSSVAMKQSPKALEGEGISEAGVVAVASGAADVEKTGQGSKAMSPSEAKTSDSKAKNKGQATTQDAKTSSPKAIQPDDGKPPSEPESAPAKAVESEAVDSKGNDPEPSKAVATVVVQLPQENITELKKASAIADAPGAKTSKEESPASEEPGHLFISATRDAALYVDGTAIRELSDPRPVREHALSPGPHQLSATFEGGLTVKAEVTAESGLELRCIAEASGSDAGKITCRSRKPRNR